MRKELLKFFYNAISHSISPPYCEYCKKFIEERSIFCDLCFEKILPIVSISLKINNDYLLNVFSVTAYEEPLKTLILAKASSNKLASIQLAELIWQISNLKNKNFDYFIPIPLHWTRYLKRGYNQSEIIASILAKKNQKEFANILKRKKITKFQSSLSNFNDKIANVKDAFSLISNYDDFEKFKDKNLVIVDDLYTSGATIVSAAKELIKLKPKTISAIVGCRVV